MADIADSTNILEKPSIKTITGKATASPSNEQANQQERRNERIEAALEKVVNLLEALTLNQSTLAKNQSTLIQRQVSLTHAFTQIAQTLTEVKAGQEHQDRVIDYLMGKNNVQIIDNPSELD